MPLSRQRTYCIVVLVLAFVLLSCFATALAIKKFTALSFGPNDSTSYLSFAAHAFDPSAKSVAHSHGVNMFLMGGADGHDDINKTLHFEPVRYVTPLLYALYPSSTSIALFYVLLFFSPLLYVAWLVHIRAIKEPFLPTLFVLTYALFPGTLVRATDNYRPFILIYPFLLLFLLSLVYRRPLAEKLAFLCALLATREEALLFSLLGIAYEFLRARKERAGYASSLPLLALWGAWAYLAALYFFWIAPTYQKNPFHSVVGTSVDPGHVVRLGMIAVSFGVALLFWALRTPVLRHKKARRALAAILICSLVVFAYQKGFFLRRTMPDAAWGTSTKLVFRAHDALPRDASILVDPRTLEAFYDFDHPVELERLSYPWTPHPEDYYPNDRDALVAGLSHSIGYVVVSSEYTDTARDLATAAGKTLVPVETNVDYGFYRVLGP